jgi:hypothetical protein
MINRVRRFCIENYYKDRIIDVNLLAIQAVINASAPFSSPVSRSDTGEVAQRGAL